MAQEFPQLLEDEAKVLADGAHDDVDLIAKAADEDVAAEMAVGFAMSDNGLEGRSAPELFLDLAGHAALLAGCEDPYRVGRVVADISLVDIGPFDLAAGQGHGLVEHVPQGVAVVRIAGQGLGVENELTALAPRVGGGDRDLDAELVRRPGLALADALGLRGMPGIELPAAHKTYAAARRASWPACPTGGSPSPGAGRMSERRCSSAAPWCRW